MVTAPSTVSAAVATAAVTATAEDDGLSATAMVDWCTVITGGVVSRTVIVRDTDRELPAASVAVHLLQNEPTFDKAGSTLVVNTTSTVPAAASVVCGTAAST